MNKLLHFSLAALLAAAGIMQSCKVNPDPSPVDESKTCRGFTQKTENVEVNMPESTVFISDDVASGLQEYDTQSGTITFTKSQALNQQRIKEGDILYSAERTEKAPDGYCLRVVSVTKNGDSVTYQTEPASILDAFDHLKESNIFSMGNYKPEDIHVYSFDVENQQPADTKAEFKVDHDGVEIKGEKYEFKSDLNSTSFKIDLLKDKGGNTDINGSIKLVLGVNIQHEMLNDNTESYFSIDEGNFVLFMMARLGVGLSLEFGNKYKLDSNPDENDESYQRQKVAEDLAKSALVGKRFRLLDLPLNYTATKVVIDPRIVVYAEFKLDVNGKLVVEGGIENGVYAINLANDGRDLKKLSYIRKITDFRPYFNLTASAKMTACIGVGAGFNFELPWLPVTDGTYTSPSAIGIWFGLDFEQSIDVSFKHDFLSGKTCMNITGEDGVLSCRASVSGVVGIKKSKVEFDFTLWPRNEDKQYEILKIAGWNIPIEISTPTPYNLQSSVNGSTALLSWSTPVDVGFTPEVWVYVDPMLSGNPTTVYKTHLKTNSVSYGPAPDGIYRWKAEIRTGDGDKYAGEPQTFEIDNSSITTGAPELGDNSASVPVRLSTYNTVVRKGVAYSSDYSEPSAETEDYVEYKGKENEFTVRINNLKDGVTYYVRSFAKIEINGGYKYIYGNVQTIKFMPALLSVSPASLDFGDVTVGESKSMKLTFTNDGGKDLNVYSITCADGFSTPFDNWSNKIVVPGKPRTFYVTFTPTAARPFGGTMIIKSDAGDNPTAVVKLSGNGKEPPKPMIAVSPSMLAFDPIVAGKGYYADLPITITNTGNASLTISSIEFRGSGSPFSITGSKPQKLDKGASATVSVRFKPTEPGVFSNTLAINSDAANASTISVTVKGEGVRGRPDKMIKTVSLRTDSPKVHNKNVSISAVYDSNDRLIRLDADDGKGNNASFKYSYSGSKMNVSAYGSSFDFSLDGQGRISAQSNQKVKFKYDSAGRLSSIDISSSDSRSILYKWSGDDIYRIVPQYADDEYYALNPRYDASEYYAPLRGADLNSLIRLFLYEIGDEFADGRISFDNGELFTVTGLTGKRSDHMLSLQFTDYQADANEVITFCQPIEYQGADGKWHTLSPYGWSEGYGTFAVRASGALSAVKCKPWTWSTDSDGAVTRAVWKQVHTTSGVTGYVTVSKGSWDRDGNGIIDENDAEFSFNGCRFRSSSDKEYNFVFSFTY